MINLKKANMDIRKELKEAGIPLWRLGIAQGCNEVTMVRRLRVELPEKEKNTIREQIKQILKENKEV